MWLTLFTPIHYKISFVFHAVIFLGYLIHKYYSKDITLNKFKFTYPHVATLGVTFLFIINCFYSDFVLMAKISVAFIALIAFNAIQYRRSEHRFYVLSFLYLFIVNFTYLYIYKSPFIDWGLGQFSARVELFFAETTWVSFIAISIFTGFFLREKQDAFSLFSILLLFFIIWVGKSRSGLLYIFVLPFLHLAVHNIHVYRNKIFLFSLPLFTVLLIVLVSLSGRELLDVSSYGRLVPFKLFMEQSWPKIMLGNSHNYDLSTVGKIGVFENSLSTVFQLLYRLGIIGMSLLCFLIFSFLNVNKVSFWPVFPAVFSSLFHPALEVPLIFLSIWSVLVVSRYINPEKEGRWLRATFRNPFIFKGFKR